MALLESGTSRTVFVFSDWSPLGTEMTNATASFDINLTSKNYKQDVKFFIMEADSDTSEMITNVLKKEV